MIVITAIFGNPKDPLGGARTRASDRKALELSVRCRVVKRKGWVPVIPQELPASRRPQWGPVLVFGRGLMRVRAQVHKDPGTTSPDRLPQSIACTASFQLPVPSRPFKDGGAETKFGKKVSSATEYIFFNALFFFFFIYKINGSTCKLQLFRLESAFKREPSRCCGHKSPCKLSPLQGRHVPCERTA